MGWLTVVLPALYWQQGLDPAVAEITRAYAVARADPSEENIFLLANRLAGVRQYAESAKFFAVGIDRFPKSARLRVGASVAAHGLGNFDEAVGHLCSAVDLDPADPRPLYFLGQMYDLSPTLAIEVTRRLRGFAERYPANAHARLYYAVSRTKAAADITAEASEIEGHFAAAIRAAPNLAEARFEFGSFLERTNRDAEAERNLAASVRLDPRLSKGWYRLAMVRQRSGDARGAARALTRFRALGSNWPAGSK